MHRIRTVVRKEWMELRRNKMVLATFILLPTLMTVWSVVMMWASTHMGGTDPNAMGKLPPAIAAKVSTAQEGSVLMFASMGIMMFLMIPSILPSVFATHSIIGEKQARSLEPLLATPLRTWELLIAKVFAAWLPAVVPAMIGFLIWMAEAYFVMPPRVLAIVSGPEWMLTVLLLGPLLGVLSVCLAVLVSSRATDMQAAQAMGGLIAIPVVGFGMGQLFTAALVSLPVVLSLSAVLLALDAGGLSLCIAMFERENILTRWK